jgi:hypothetical protein
VRKLNKPKDDAKAVFLACIGNMRETPLKVNLRAVSDNIEKEAAIYDSKAK